MIFKFEFNLFDTHSPGLLLSSSVKLWSEDFQLLWPWLLRIVLLVSSLAVLGILDALGLSWPGTLVLLVFFLVSVYLIQYSFQVLDFVVDLIDRFPGREFVKKIIYVPVIMRNFKIATFSIVKFSGKLNWSGGGEYDDAHTIEF